jgi:hypothetical protein
LLVPLVLDPETISEAALRDVVRTLREELAETEDLVRNPKGRVLDPASLETAHDLVRSARAFLDRPASPGRASLAAEANLAYAVLLAAIDLVKSHTDVPKVPPPRPSRTPAA